MLIKWVLTDGTKYALKTLALLITVNFDGLLAKYLVTNLMKFIETLRNY